MRAFPKKSEGTGVDPPMQISAKAGPALSPPSRALVAPRRAQPPLAPSEAALPSRHHGACPSRAQSTSARAAAFGSTRPGSGQIYAGPPGVRPIRLGCLPGAWKVKVGSSPPDTPASTCDAKPRRNPRHSTHAELRRHTYLLRACGNALNPCPSGPPMLTPAASQALPAPSPPRLMRP